MALSSALFSGISGLSTLGNAMQVIGDNIANVNTVGFKGSTFTFQDLLSQSVATRAGTSQVGRGTALADIVSNFSQGSFESTGNTTDLAIGGEGFFAVRNSTADNLYYTRAGNFRFDENGNLVNPEGYIVQGWAVDKDGNIMGSTTDIALTSFTSQPEPTDNVTVITNLNQDTTSNSEILSSQWNGTSNPPINTAYYEYQSTVKAYDALGSTHDITVYYDKTSGSDWEYIVTCNPSEDLRSGFKGTSSAGLLGRGTITFSESDGTISDMSMSRITSPTGATSQAVVRNATSTIPVDNMSITVNNAEALTASGTVGLSYNTTTSTWSITTPATGYSIMAGATPTQVQIEAGTADGIPDITVNLTTAPTATTNTASLGITGSTAWDPQVTTDIDEKGYYEFQADFIGGAATTQDIALNIGSKWNGTTQVPDSLATTQFASSSTTVFQSADGYGPGALQGVDVNGDGLITGSYSNGQVLPLYRLALAKFQSVTNLKKLGGNLYSETRESGTATTGQPNQNGLGSISANSLEQSNVDIANEFVKMITTQRGFQANSKIITVTDEMLADLINLKR
jgi:flagellar hook protein FlgE